MSQPQPAYQPKSAAYVKAQDTIAHLIVRFSVKNRSAAFIATEIIDALKREGWKEPS